MLKNWLGDPSLAISIKSVGIKNSLSYEKILVQILDYQNRKLRTKELCQSKSHGRINLLRSLHGS